MMRETVRTDLPVDHPDFQPACGADVERWANTRRAKLGLPPVRFIRCDTPLE